MDISLASIEADLGPALTAFQQGHIHEAVDLGSAALSSIRQRAGSDWPKVIAHLRGSELMEIAQQCPFTNHSFRRPRGYPGDALLLDWIYRDFRLLKKPSEGSFPSRLYRRNISCTPATAVRWRRQHLATLIDDIAIVKPNARVLAVAAGHLREADLSIALQRGRLRELVALDQDAQSLAEIDTRYSVHGIPIETVHSPIKELITGKYKVEDFDLIYSAGLYDYLDGPVAQSLTTTLFNGLNPGGQLVTTNFLHSTPDLGWMESMADWFLIYRSIEDVAAFADGIAEERIARSHSYVCPTGAIGYLSLRKRQ